ncbi:hypothetical protein CC86DRAFT_450900 [Ophiobolus disseminans]|uniref:Uncharacterized protein n=1 Tax=Ophiobolus disseminans TaxID=1469910 RepID=A0A6A7AK54_9PLEO|nr:hypothetical protein CC86DRAFT_450900 [Ophiobolus disseminans]
MSDLQRHRICTDGRKHAYELEDAVFNGWKNPASAANLAYRKRAAKLIFGSRDITGADPWAALSGDSKKGEVTRPYLKRERGLGRRISGLPHETPCEFRIRETVYCEPVTRLIRRPSKRRRKECASHLNDYARSDKM